MKNHLVCFLVFACCVGSPHDGFASGPGPASVLTSAREIRLLAPGEAARALPVRLEGVITHVDWSTAFVQDETAATFIGGLGRYIPISSLKRGQRIRVEGKTFPGLYIPGIQADRFQLLEMCDGPAPIPVTLDDLASGRNHYQWVEIEGIGRSVAATGEGSSRLRIAVASREVLEVYVDELPPGGVSFVDARLSVQGLAAGKINDHRQLVTPYLETGSYQLIRVVDPPPDAAALPMLPIANLLRFTPDGAGAAEHRVKLRGVVLGHLPNGSLFLREGKYAIRIASIEAEGLRPGDEVEVLGFPRMGPFRAFLEDATIRRIGPGAPPEALELSPTKPLKGEHEANLVKLVGRLAASDSDPEGCVLVLRDDGFPSTFRVLCPGSPKSPWPEGSLLAVTGICRVVGSTVKGYNLKPSTVELWARDPGDVRLLESPSWLTEERLTRALGMLAAATAAILVWGILMRRRVREQTAVIRDQLSRELLLEERQRIAREVHDTLEQELVGLTLRLDAATAVAEPPMRALLETARRLVARIQAEIRHLIWDLRDRAAGDAGLEQALTRLIQHWEPNSTSRFCVAVTGEPWPLPGLLEHNLLRITQEALTNALKHGRAETVDLELSYFPERLELRISDDGLGFDADARAEQPGHFGLVGMRERARKSGARLAIASAPGRGTSVEVVVPRRLALKQEDP